MKKILSIALVLVLSLTFAAFAEQHSYIMAGILDADGNTVAELTDDGSAVLDADGNDITDQYPVFTLVIDNETKECAMGNETETTAGTYEITAEDTENNIDTITFTFEDGEVVEMNYLAEDDVLYYAQDGITLILMNMDLFA